MNRRDALKSLVAVPGIASVHIATVQRGDTVVIHCDHELSPANVDQLYRYARICFPETTVLVLKQGMRLEIVRPTP